MSETIDNPFRITKSNNLTDEQIDALWVTPDSGEETESFSRPTSRMAMFILGGKGSGKSHLMPYYGLPLQVLRFQKRNISVLEGIRADKYVGLYSLCKGMNAHRFNGKGQNQDKWNDLFAYYFELWAADKTLAFVEMLIDEGNISEDLNGTIAREITHLFDRPLATVSSITAVRGFLAELRKNVDFAINNVTMSGRLEVDILLSRGRLLFGLPNLIVSHIASLADVIFLHLLDEFENFDENQQTYINTLIREKEGPVSFKIGARLYGVRTRNTLSGGEKNREGSEYEERRLDDRYRKDQQVYKEFAIKLIARRLQAANYTIDNSIFDEARLENLFEVEDFSADSDLFKGLFHPDKERFHLLNLRRKLLKGLREQLVVGPRTEDDVELIVSAVSFPSHPLVEKLCILHIFQQWYRSADLLATSERVREAALSYIAGHRGDQFTEFFNKHKSDMVAQLLRENGRPQVYASLPAFVRMSEGLPRALITLLKQTFDWAAYTQERPLRENPFSVRAQQRGASDAASLFLDEMLMEGDDGVLVQSSVHRLAQLFRVNRFADKPIETSMIAFSVDELQLKPEPRRILRLAINTSLIVDVARGQRERNSEQITSKLELNTMLSPRYDLPIARRGVVPLSSEDVDTIFTHGAGAEFEKMLKEWESKMTAPGFGRARPNTSTIEQNDSSQPSLFE